jgi:hypothetical protein
MHVGMQSKCPKRMEQTQRARRLFPSFARPSIVGSEFWLAWAAIKGA